MSAAGMPESLHSLAPKNDGSTSWSLLQRLWKQESWSTRKYAALFLLATVFLGAIQGAEVYMIKPLIESLQSPDKAAHFNLTFVAFFYLVSGTLKALAMYVEVRSLAGFVLRIAQNLRSRLLNSVMGLDLAQINAQGPSHYLSLFFSDIERFTSHFRQMIDAAIGQGIVLFVIVVVMVVVSPLLSLVCVILVIGLAFPMMWIGKRIRATTRKLHEDLTRMTGFVSEVLRGMKQIKAFNRQEHTTQSSQSEFEHLFQLERQSWVASVPMAMISAFTISIIIGLLILGGGDKLRDGTLTIPQIASFFAALITAYRPLRVVSNVGPMLHGTTTALSRLYQVMDTPDSDKSTRSLPPIAISGGGIVFDNISFRYNKGSIPVIDGISLSIRSCESLALVGPTGAGKSTLVNLIPRFFDPTEGQVLIDGQDLRDVNVYSLREHISLVSQDVTLFQGTLRSNLQMARPESITESEMYEALTQVGIAQMVDRLPHQLDTVIHEDGQGLSGGQRQLLSIARAFLARSSILIFDEPTSSLDSESEMRIRQSLQALSKGKTVVVIAHRLSTVQQADRIVVLQQGKILETGNHQQLMMMNGLYASYFHKQNGSGNSSDDFTESP